MMNTPTRHQPFAELPLEARALFFFYASAALARYQSHAPTHELLPELEAIWNINQLSQRDLTDPFQLTRFLEQHFTLSASKAGTTLAKSSRHHCRRASK
jgi:hypothetical protein